MPSWASTGARIPSATGRPAYLFSTAAVAYDREVCEVAVRITRPDTGAVLAAQAELIRKLKPRDNVLGVSRRRDAEDDSVPF